MTSPQLYLHETVDIVGQGAWPYLAHTRDAAGDEKVNFALQGTWYVMGITGRWPQAVNIWDVPGGWDGWQESVERLGLARPANTELAGWWTVAQELRSGGFDRLLAGAPGCPTTEELVAAGVQGTVFVHEVARTRPGAAADHLAAVLEHRAPVLARYGHRLTGLYETLFTDDEVVTVWATTPADHVRAARADLEARRASTSTSGSPLAEVDPDVVAWQVTARDHLVHRREELMTPCPGTPLGPPLDAVSLDG